MLGKASIPLLFAFFCCKVQTQEPGVGSVVAPSMRVVMRSMAAFGHLASSKGAWAPAQGGQALAPPLVSPEEIPNREFQFCVFLLNFIYRELD